MMHLQSLLRRRPIFLVWLALLLSIGVTGDLIVDLVFEDQASAATSIPSEEPDNAAEHILIPSERSQRPDTVLAASSDNVAPLVSIQEPRFAISLPYVLVRLDHPPPRNLPLSFLTPLRI